MESPKWTEIAAVVIAFVGVLITILKSKWAVTQLFSRWRRRRRIDFQFFKENLTDGSWKKMDDYSLAYSYWALTGYRFEASTLRYLLGQKEPLDKLIEYAYGARFLTVKRDQSRNVNEISLKKLFGTANTRIFQIKLINFCFALSAFLAVSPMIVPLLINQYSSPIEYTSKGIFLGALWIFAFTLLCIIFFLSMRDLEAARKLTRELAESRQCEPNNGEETNISEDS